MQSPEQLRVLVEEYLGDLALTPELHGQAESVRYALVGGKRARAVICLATVEAAGAEAEAGLRAARLQRPAAPRSGAPGGRGPGSGRGVRSATCSGYSSRSSPTSSPATATSLHTAKTEPAVSQTRLRRVRANGSPMFRRTRRRSWTSLRASRLERRERASGAVHRRRRQREGRRRQIHGLAPSGPRARAARS